MNVEIRRAGPADADDLADAHLDSIRTIGRLYYDESIVNDWARRIASEMYLRAMAHGEVFFLAVGNPGAPAVLGFSSHRINGHEHRTAVYVRGRAARRGIGSALFRVAETAAIQAGATSINVDASLAAIGFYKANGFEERGRGMHRLSSGRDMPCVFMRKDLTAQDAASAHSQ